MIKVALDRPAEQCDPIKAGCIGRMEKMIGPTKGIRANSHICRYFRQIRYRRQAPDARSTGRTIAYGRPHGGRNALPFEEHADAAAASAFVRSVGTPSPSQSTCAVQPANSYSILGL